MNIVYKVLPVAATHKPKAKPAAFNLVDIEYAI